MFRSAHVAIFVGWGYFGAVNDKRPGWCISWHFFFFFCLRARGKHTHTHTHTHPAQRAASGQPPSVGLFRRSWWGGHLFVGRPIALALEGLQARLDALHFAFVAFAFRFLPLLLQNADQVISLTHLE
jgi:hypothetical protein